jgi:hypothetical protein
VTSYWCINHVSLWDHRLTRRYKHSLVWSLSINILVPFLCSISYKYNTKETKQNSSKTYTDLSSSIVMRRSRSVSSDCSGTFWITFVSCKWTFSTFMYQRFVGCTVCVIIGTYYATGLSTVVTCTVNMLRFYMTAPILSKTVLWPEMEVLFCLE